MFFTDPTPADETDSESEAPEADSGVGRTENAVAPDKRDAANHFLQKNNNKLAFHMPVLNYDNAIVQPPVIRLIEKDLMEKDINISFTSYLKFNINSTILTFEAFISIIEKFGNLYTIGLGNFFITEKNEKFSYLINIMWSYNDPSDKNSISVYIYTKNFKESEQIKQFVLSSFSKYIENEKLFADISWYCMAGPKLQEFDFTEELDDTILSEAYPYIDKSLYPGGIISFINSYINSKEPLLLLVGPPGTGKTRLIRNILKIMAERGQKLNLRLRGIFTSDKRVVEESSIYVRFLAGSYTFLVIEDMDYHLQKRSDGNFSMYNLLSISDGLLRNSGQKKIILSTNLPNVKNIDDALLRPGRCFSILNTRHLTYDESKVLIEKLGHTADTLQSHDQFKASLADIYKIHKT